MSSEFIEASIGVFWALLLGGIGFFIIWGISNWVTETSAKQYQLEKKVKALETELNEQQNSAKE